MNSKEAQATQPPAGAKPIEVALETCAVALNFALGFCFYVAHGVFSHPHLLKTNLAVLAEWGFLFGLTGIIAVFVFRRMLATFPIRFGFLLVITMFNQICLSALLVSLLPFGGKVIPPS